MRQASIVIKRIHKEHKAFYSNPVGKGALRALQTDFPFPWLYVAELLQNAVDAKAKTIRLETDRKLGELTFEHDGEGFNEAQVKALCSKGISTKGARAVGFMGVGFKSVFHSYERVDVSSGEWRFYLEVPAVTGRRYGDRQRIWLGSVLPREDSGIEPPSPGMRCRFVLRERLDRKSSPDDDISEIVSGDHDVLLPLLASRGVKRLEVGDARWRLGRGKSISAGDQVSRRIVDARNEATGVGTRWMIFSAGYFPSKQAIARFLEHRQVDLDDPGLAPAERRKLRSDAKSERVVDLLCPLGAGRIPIPPVQPHLHALLKTAMDSPIGLDIQADWLLVTTRRELVDPTNAWHQEMFAQVPRLLKAFLEWACSVPKLRDEHLPAIYRVLPDLSGIESTAGSSNIWNPQLQKSLRSSLRSARLLPARVKGAVSFLSPRQARLLPESLWAMDDPALGPWEIFGSRIISGVLLGERGLRCLRHLDLLRELNSDELVHFWQDGKVGIWMSGLKRQGAEALMKLLACLTELDEYDEWRNAGLLCLPSESGDTWLHRKIARCLPKDWHAVPDKSPNIRELLTPFLPSKDETVALWLDRKIMAVAAPASYIDSVDREVLEDIIGRWWASLPANPTEDDTKRVVEFTNWVRTKQRSRMSLVKKVLCDSGSAIVLVPWKEAALADPYASSARRRFFPDRRFVSSQYLYHDPSASAADWQSFFESISNEMAGKFVMYSTRVEMSDTALERALPGYTPPDTRATSMWPHPPTWGGKTFSEFNYLLIDYLLPPGLRSCLEDGVNDDSAADIAEWLQEGMRDLSFYRKRAIVYVPRNLGRPERLQVPFSPSWVQQLQTVKWVWSQGHPGPYTPRELLPVHDTARPRVPVARLPAALIGTLAQCGIDFGIGIPEVSDVARLRLEGPEAGADRICELIGAADAGTSHDPDLRRDFLDALNDTPLFSVPAYIALIDQARRIPAARLILNTNRGDLGRWLLSVDRLRSGSAEQRLATLITRILKVPEKPTHSQGLSFLQWVWQTGPDADLVRRVLPQAYALLHEGITERSFSQVSIDIVGKARVFTSTRQWVEVSGGKVYLDDIGDARLRQIVASHGIELATAGHLGATASEQLRTAGHLKLPLLSSRYALKPDAESKSRADQSWEERFRSIQHYLLQRIAREEEEDGMGASPRIISLFTCARLKLAAVENQVRLDEWYTLAICVGNEAIVSGEPSDFMAELCTRLLEAYDLSMRRYVHSLGPEVTQLLGLLDQPDRLSKLMERFRARYGLLHPAASSATDAGTDVASDVKTGPSGPVGTSSELGARKPSGHAGAETPVAGSTAGTQDPVNAEAQVDQLAVGEHASGEVGQSSHRAGVAGWNEERATAHVRSMIQKIMFAGVAPSADEPEDGQESDYGEPSEFGTDERFRLAVLDFETSKGRYPMARDEAQPGYDIDSFTHAEGDPNRRLLRRIEVKGRSAEWKDSEAVALSSRQFFDAQRQVVEDGIPLADGFDYWLYVVESDTDETGYHVVPIRNPACLVAKYLFRGDLWRHLAEEA